MTDINSIKVSGTTYTLADSVARNKVTTGSTVPTSSGSAGDLYVRNTDPYPSGYIRIGTPAELVAFATRVNAGETSLDAYLTADIDMDGVSFTPIGNNIKYGYSGTFDGYGCVIRNITSSSASVNCHEGLFGTVRGGTIQNIRCEGFDISGIGSVGSLVGYADSASISNCYAYGCTVSSTGDMNGVGGLVGYAISGSTISTISNCYAYSCTVSGGLNVGGLVGYAFSVSTISTISNCYAYSCTVSGGTIVGGLVGRSRDASVSNCAIYGGNKGDTLIGYGSSTTTNCYSSSTSGMTEAIFKTQGFWDGTGVSGTTYLSWDFDDTWEWDSTNSLPKLQSVAVSVDTYLYTYNGSEWVLLASNP